MKIKTKSSVVCKGLGMPWPVHEHQSIQTLMTKNFEKLFPSLENHIQNCFKLKKEKEKVPDICIYNKVIEKNGLFFPYDPLVVIEVDNDNSEPNTKEKPPFVYSVFPTTEEFFSYRYDKKYFLKYEEDDCDNPSKDSFSETLGFDIRKLLNCDEKYFSKINVIQRKLISNWQKHTNEIDNCPQLSPLIPIGGDEYAPYYMPRITLFQDDENLTDPLLTIEVVDDDTEWLTSKIVKKYMEANPTIEEGWLYNMDTKTWKKVKNGRMMEACLSKVLDLDMRETI